MSRYYGRYSNASRGQRRQASTLATGKGASQATDLSVVMWIESEWAGCSVPL